MIPQPGCPNFVVKKLEKFQKTNSETLNILKIKFDTRTCVKKIVRLDDERETNFQTPEGKPIPFKLITIMITLLRYIVYMLKQRYIDWCFHFLGFVDTINDPQ